MGKNVFESFPSLASFSICGKENSAGMCVFTYRLTSSFPTFPRLHSLFAII